MSSSFSSRARQARSWSRAVGVLAAAIGAIAIAGWLVGSEGLASLVPGRRPISPETAACLILGGLTLWQVASDWPGRRRLPIGAALIALAGAVRLLGFFLDRPGMTAERELPGLLGRVTQPPMAPTTALALILIAVALLALYERDGRSARLPQALGATAAFISLSAVIGHAYGAGVLYDFGTATMSLPAALGCLALGVGIVAADIRTGPAALLAGDGPGGRFARRDLPVAIAIPFVAGWLRMLGEGRFYDAAGGGALLVVASIGLLTWLLWSAARSLDRTERERVAATEATRRVEAEYRRLVDASPDAVWVHRAGRIVLANEASARLLGLPAGESLVGRHVLDFIPPESREIVIERIRSVAAGGAPPRPIEQDFVRADGARTSVELSARAIVFQGEPAILALLRDVSERLLAQRRLAESEARFRGLLEAAPDGFVIVDGDGRIVFANQETERLFGWPRDDLIGRDVETLVPEGGRPAHRHHRARYAMSPVRRAMGSTLELEATRRDGSTFPVEISLSPLDTPGGTLITAAVRDISARRRMQNALRHTNEELARALAEVKQLTGMLPICASCKRVRDDRGYWQQIEVYLSAHSEATFSHGFCPECAHQLYGVTMGPDEGE